MKQLDLHNVSKPKKVEKNKTIPNIFSFFKNKRKPLDFTLSNKDNNLDESEVNSCNSCVQSMASCEHKEHKETKSAALLQTSRTTKDAPRGRGKSLMNSALKCPGECRGRGARRKSRDDSETACEDRFEIEINAPECGARHFNLELKGINSFFIDAESPLVFQDASIKNARMVYLCHKE